MSPSAPNLTDYRRRLGPSSKEPPFVVLGRVGPRRGRKRITGRMTTGIARLKGLQCIKKFAVVQCPLCHEFRIAGQGQKYVRCPHCSGRFWLFNAPVLATNDNRAILVSELPDIRRRWLSQILR